MNEVGFWPVAVVPVGQVACATTLWKAKGRLSVTVVVKARFSFVHNAVMAPIPPEPVRPEVGELAPYLTQADVVVSAAHAHPKDASPAPALAVRLALFREWAVIDKSLLVYPADDEGRRAHAVTGPIPVARPPGTGKGRLGILVNPRDSSHPGSLGPLPAEGHQRVALLGEMTPPVAQHGVYEIPNMFPWSYFQVAPPDQRTSYLRGDEWIVLDGLDREHPRLQSRLPQARAQVAVYPPGLTRGSSFAVHMEADQLSIDVDRKECAMLWRGSFPVADEASARAVVLVAGVGTPHRPVVWPDVGALMSHPILQAHGLVRQGSPRRGLPSPRPGLVQEDEASMAQTRNMSADDAAAMFAQLDEDTVTGEIAPAPPAMSGDPGAPGASVDAFLATAEVEPDSVRSAEVGELEMSLEGVLSVHTLSESVILEVMKLVGEEELQAAISGEDGARQRTALGLPKPASRMLKPVHMDPHVEELSEGGGRSHSQAPELATQSVDQLEVTLSDALTAQGIPTIDHLPWRRDSD